VKYKILHSHDGDVDCYTMYEFDRELTGEDLAGKVILVFETETYEQAMFVRSQFLHFEPYRPFGKFWLAKVGYWISIAGKVKSKHNYEERCSIVLADDRADAIARIRSEAREYSTPYKNIYNQEVVWAFDRIIEVEEMGCFDSVDLYGGKPVEIHSKRISKKSPSTQPGLA
jgi:Domain of unknown function (DUF4288)